MSSECLQQQQLYQPASDSNKKPAVAVDSSRQQSSVKREGNGKILYSALLLNALYKLLTGRLVQ